MYIDNYFEFINLDNNQISKKEIPFNYGNSWIKNFNTYSEKGKIIIFKIIKLINNWKTNNIAARGNNGGFIKQFTSNDNYLKKIVLNFYHCYYSKRLNTTSNIKKKYINY